MHNRASLHLVGPRVFKIYVFASYDYGQAVTGVVLADDSKLSESSIVALAVIFGLVFFIVLSSTICYCLRKRRYQENRKRSEKLSEVKKIIEEHYSESKTPYSTDTMVSSLKYKDWRQHQPNPTIGMSQVVNQKWTTGNDTGYVIRTNRSASPTRSAPRSPGFERGRSRQRTLVYTNQPAYNTLMVKKRSKSAPAYERQVSREFVRNVPNKQYMFTKSHFLAIKQPFSKKFLLPPTRTFYTERPVRVAEPPRRVVEVFKQPIPQPLPPPPPKKEVVKSNVYHVQYQPGPNQIVHRTNKISNSDDYNYNTRTVTSNVRTYTEPQHTTYSYGNTYGNSYGNSLHQTYRSYEEPVPMRTKVIKADPQMYTTLQQSGDNRGQVWSGNSVPINGGRVVSYLSDDVFIQRNSSYRHSFGKEARVYNGIEQTKTVEDDYTIVDFIEDGNAPQKNGFVDFAEPGPSGEGTTVGVTMLSTSTPRAPQADSSALNDLDDVLDHHSVPSPARSSTSSSSSSSSSKSSKKD
ncbi:hypothetical protein ACF0H5_001313 [Mactra antiquata]